MEVERNVRFFCNLNDEGLKFGVIRNGEVLIQPIYDEAYGFEDLEDEFGWMEDIGIVRKGRRWGVINNDLEEVLPFKYSKIKIDGYLTVTLKGKMGVYSRKGEEILPVEYDHIWCNIVIAYARKGDSNFYFDLRNGIVEPMDAAALAAHPGYERYLKGAENNNYKFSPSDEFKEKCKKYTKVFDKYENDLYIVKRGRKYGCVDKAGDEVLPVIYQEVEILHFNNRIRVKLKDQYGYFDFQGNQITPICYLWARDYFTEDRAIVMCSGGDEADYYSLIDLDGKFITKRGYDDIEDLCQGRARVQIDWLWGYIDKDGEDVTSLKYSTLSDFISDVAVYSIDGRYGLINYDGVEITEPLYDRVVWLGTEKYLSIPSGTNRRSGKEYGVVQQDGKFGLIDKSGTLITEIIYDEIWSYSRGLMQVKIGKRCGMINLDGKEVIPVKYSDIDYNVFKFMYVKYRGKWAVFNYEGERVTPFVFDEIDGYFAVLDGKTYMVNERGEISDKSVGGTISTGCFHHELELDWKKLPRRKRSK